MSSRKYRISHWLHTLKRAWRWYASLYHGRAWYTKSAVATMSFIVIFFLYLGMVDINFLWLFGKSPGFSRIMDPHTSEASEIYSADGVLIGKFFSENRTPVRYSDVAPDFWKALVDTEDARFYEHHGVDPVGVLGAAKDALFHHDARGASTITQQLAKNMFRIRTQYSTGLLGNIPGIKMLIMKTKEWIIATKLELVYDKKDILTMYANTVDFGSNSFGIKTAAKTYFNTTPSELTTEQAAVLVGMLKATTFYNPVSNPENSLRRRNVVLQNMRNMDDLTQELFDSLREIPLRLNYSVESNYDGKANYFRQALLDHLHKWCKDNDYDLYADGLKVYTTIDTRMQAYAEQAVRKQMQAVQRQFDEHWSKEDPWQDENHRVIPGFIEGIAKKLPLYEALTQQYPNQPDSVMAALNRPHKVKLFDYQQGTIEREMSTLDSIRYMVRFMHGAFLAMEPQTGFIKAWVGDIDFNSWKYDKVTAMRQPGSTFKLFVYTEAINQGLTPCDKRRDEYISMEVYDKKLNKTTVWTPNNASGSFSGDSLTLRSAFARSTNSVAVRLGQEMGIRNIIATAHDMGIKSPLEEAPALALGASDVNLLEMVNAYATVADNGKRADPVLVTKIVDREGREVFLAPSVETQVLPYKTAFFMQKMLQAAIGEPGATGAAMDEYIGHVHDTDFGGKTGTSNNHSDAWFVCVTPQLVCGAWVGGEYRSIHFRSGALGQGSRTALPLCGLFMRSVMNDKQFKSYHQHFKSPQGQDIAEQQYDCTSYPEEQVDSLAADSLSIDGMPTDEYGNPIGVEGDIVPPTDDDDETDNAKEVTFDDL